MERGRHGDQPVWQADLDLPPRLLVQLVSAARRARSGTRAPSPWLFTAASERRGPTRDHVSEARTRLTPARSAPTTTLRRGAEPAGGSLAVALGLIASWRGPGEAGRKRVAEAASAVQAAEVVRGFGHVLVDHA
jgi:hypothetical protein